MGCWIDTVYYGLRYITAYDVVTKEFYCFDLMISVQLREIGRATHLFINHSTPRQLHNDCEYFVIHRRFYVPRFNWVHAFNGSTPSSSFTDY